MKHFNINKYKLKHNNCINVYLLKTWLIKTVVSVVKTRGGLHLGFDSNLIAHCEAETNFIMDT